MAEYLGDAIRRVMLAGLEDATLDASFTQPLSVNAGVYKIGHVVPVSTDLAMDYGVIPDTREPVKVSRRQRLRWRWQEKRYTARMRLASWVVGFDVTERD